MIETFPDYSQLDSKWGFESGLERTMCGIVCTKALLDYYSRKKKKPAVAMSSLIETLNESKSRVSNGIKHSVEVDVLSSQGLIAWRRNWNAPSNDVQWLIDNEQYTQQQVDKISYQQQAEHTMPSKETQELYSIAVSLQNDNPVIASVRAGFGGNKGDHQIVIIGSEEENGATYYKVMDPERPAGTTIHAVPVDHFFEYFNNRAIFATEPVS
jgi:hypothetical protein